MKKQSFISEIMCAFGLHSYEIRIKKVDEGYDIFTSKAVLFCKCCEKEFAKSEIKR